MRRRRGGYDPPVRLCNRRLRGARRLGAPSVGATCGRPLIEDAPLAERACPAGAPLSFPKKAVGKKGPGGSAHPGPPKNGGSWRRWVVRAGQRPGVHCRPLYWRLRHGRCRASGGTHRDYPASLGSGCAVPTWPAGPPSVPCLRNTVAAAVAGKRRVKDAAPYIVGPSYGSFASGQARKLIPSAGPPLPTATTPLGRRGGPNFYARPEPRGRYSVSPPAGQARPYFSRLRITWATLTPEAPAWARPRVMPAPSPAAKKPGRAVSSSLDRASRAE